MYSLKTVDRNEKSTHKSHNSFIRYDEYHEISPYEVDKRSLTDFDNKRYIKDDGIHTLSYGHKDIPK